LTQLAIDVETPSEKFTIMSKGKRVTISSGASLHFSITREFNLGWHFDALVFTGTKLAHPCFSPTVHVAIIRNRKGVKRAGSDLGNKFSMEKCNLFWN
jgi:hypothetical protein